MARTIQQLAKEACDVQDACNLVAVVNGMGRALKDLGEHVTSSNELQEHPVSRAWADKIASLTGAQGYNEGAIDAHTQCEKLARS